jgi:hypothetical protein
MWGWEIRRRIRAGITLGVMLSLFMTSVTYGWSATNAIAYANRWWTDYNPVYRVYESDCVNFVSQAVFAGGYPMNSSTNNPWYANCGYENAYNKSWRLVQYAPPEGHAALVVSISGTATTTGETSSIIVNAHTNDRYHEYWTRSAPAVKWER